MQYKALELHFFGMEVDSIVLGPVLASWFVKMFIVTEQLYTPSFESSLATPAQFIMLGDTTTMVYKDLCLFVKRESFIIGQ